MPVGVASFDSAIVAVTLSVPPSITETLIPADRFGLAPAASEAAAGVINQRMSLYQRDRLPTTARPW